jgi:tRNA 2-(methylsulfanyl)-N6-isopentenyladenosine37 hydroxylase
MALSAPAPLAGFFGTATSPAWVLEACRRLPELLLDHANCELKAASTAVGFIYRYPERGKLAQQMSRLAREELRHFEQVRRLLERRSIAFERLSASRYASTLRRAVRQGEPERLLDLLLVSALIEARSCERFAALAPHLPPDLGDFYGNLVVSEARHFEHYLAFAGTETAIEGDAFDDRLRELKVLEARLISDPDDEFRFHSGSVRAAQASDHAPEDLRGSR